MWVANTSRAESFDNPLFLREEAREFQIHKSFFKGQQTKLFVEITFMREGKTIEVISFPEKGQSNDINTWVNVKWE